MPNAGWSGHRAAQSYYNPPLRSIFRKLDGIGSEHYKQQRATVIGPLTEG
jgi:hypothetical protein